MPGHDVTLMAAASEPAGDGAANSADAAAAPQSRVRPAVADPPRISLWVPPASPYSLIEEVLYVDPWKLLLACMLLNKTNAKQVG